MAPNNTPDLGETDFNRLTDKLKDDEAAPPLVIGDYEIPIRLDSAMPPDRFELVSPAGVGQPLPPTVRGWADSAPDQPPSEIELAQLTWELTCLLLRHEEFQFELSVREGLWTARVRSERTLVAGTGDTMTQAVRRLIGMVRPK